MNSMLPMAIAVEISPVMNQAMRAVVVVANNLHERAFKKLLRCDSRYRGGSCFIFIYSIVVLRLAKKETSPLRSLRSLPSR